MRKILIGLVGVLAIAGFGLWLQISSNNPETLPLNDETRRSAPGSFVELSDGLVHYDLAGPEGGQVVVLVHGFSVPYYIWNTTTAALSNAGYRVLRFDAFGRGYSDRPSTRYDGALFERQLSELIDTLELTTPLDIVGLSMGGAVTAGFVAKQPDRIRRVVFIDPSNDAFGPPPVPRPIGDWIMALRLFPTIAEGQMADFVVPENYPDWVERYRVQMQFRGFRNAIVSTLYDFGPEDHLAKFAAIAPHEKPVLLIWGEQDRTLPIGGADRIRGVLDVEFVAIPDAGHLPHIEQAGSTNRRIVEFLGRP